MQPLPSRRALKMENATNCSKREKKEWCQKDDIKKMEENEMLEMKICTALTGLSNDYVAGNGSSMFVPRRALVHTLVMFSLRPADVHHQGPGVGLHGDVGVLIDVKVGPVSSPGETEEQKNRPVL